MTHVKPKEANERRPVARSTSPSDAGSYYGRPIIKPPIWDRGIAGYFFLGGLAAGASLIAQAARSQGNDRLARAGTLAAAVGVSLSPPLLIRDLGRPTRFYNMLRVFKPTSPMNVGTWVLSLDGSLTGLAAMCELTGRLPRIGKAAETGSALLAPVLATYTGVLVADTAVPVWHEARYELPLLFASGAASTGGAAAMLLAPPADAAAARRAAIGGSLAEEAISKVMERRLGDLGEPYHHGPAGRYARLATRLTLAGTAVVAAGGRFRWPARAGAALTLAGGLCRRMAVYHAGFESAIDPKYTVESQRRRIRERDAVSAGRAGRRRLPGLDGRFGNGRRAGAV